MNRDVREDQQGKDGFQYTGRDQPSTLRFQEITPETLVGYVDGYLFAEDLKKLSDNHYKIPIFDFACQDFSSEQLEKIPPLGHINFYISGEAVLEQVEFDLNSNTFTEMTGRAAKVNEEESRRVDVWVPENFREIYTFDFVNGTSSVKREYKETPYNKGAAAEDKWKIHDVNWNLQPIMRAVLESMKSDQDIEFEINLPLEVM